MIRTQLILEKAQHEKLVEIARLQNRSLSDLVREYLDEQIQVHKQRQMIQAAKKLKVDYLSNNELTAFSSLDGDASNEAG